MKSNFFKIVLPAFALMLAITASLAFTSNTSDEIPVEITLTSSDMTEGFWDDNGTAVVIPTGLRPITCETVQNPDLCTVNIPFKGLKTVYHYNDNGVVSVPLYKPLSE